MVADRLAGLRGLRQVTQLRCLALVTDAFGGRGGIAQYNRDLCSALAECGAAVSVVTRSARDRIVTPIGVRQALAVHGKLLYALSALLWALCQRADIVFCGHLHMAPLAWLVSRLKGATLIVQMHGIEAWSPPSRLRRLATESADLLLCVSRHTRAHVLGWAAIAPERALVVPNTVGDAFSPGDGAALRASLGLKGKRVLLTVGRMDARERYKGHDRVIAALPGLLSQGHEVVYVVIGEGDDRQRLEAYAIEKGVVEYVRFLGGTDTQTAVEAYRMADLFVMPSTGEGFGIAFLEAMASGTPALGLAVGGARDALVDGDLGTAISELDDLTGEISRLLRECKRDAWVLSTALRSRFGRTAFINRVRGVLERLGELA